MQRTSVPGRPVMIARNPVAFSAQDLVAKVPCTHSGPNAITLGKLLARVDSSANSCRPDRDLRDENLPP